MQNMWGPARNTKLRDMEIQDMLILQTFQNPGRALGSQLMLTQQSRSAKRYLWMKIGLSTANVSEQISEPAALALHLVAFGIASLVAMGRLWSKRPDRDTQGAGQGSPARCWCHPKHHGGSRQVKKYFYDLLTLESMMIFQDIFQCWRTQTYGQIHWQHLWEVSPQSKLKKSK